MDNKELTRQFEDKTPLFKRLKEEALFTLEPALKKQDIKIHAIDSRVKTSKSFIDKTNSKDLKNPFDDIQDIVGLRVVCLFLADIARIGEVIRDSFTVLSEDNKVESCEAKSFGYLAVHFVVAIKDGCSGPRYDEIVGVPFEIQVRTIAMHAWATISHYLDYKTEGDVPKELRRDFYALSGLFYVADTHFEMFAKASKESRDKMVKTFEQANPEFDQEINLDSLTAYLHKKFPNREQSEPKDISALVNELLQTGYKSILDIEHAIEIAWDAFIRYEEEHPPNDCQKFKDVGVIRILFDLFDDNFRLSRESPVDEYEEYRIDEYEEYKKLLKKQ